MHLAPASFDPQAIKGEIVQYCRGLTASIKNHHALIAQSFSQCTLGKVKTVSITPSNLEISSTGKELSYTSLQSPYQAPPTPVPPNSKEQTLGESCDTSKKSSKP